MDYLDFDVEIGAGAGRDYPIFARSPVGQTKGNLRFPFDRLELDNYLLLLQKALLVSGGTSHRLLAQREQAVHEFGQRLFEALFSEDVRGLYYFSLQKAQEEANGMRLRLHIQAPDLAALPWEYLYDPGLDEFLCLSHSTSVVRYPELAEPIQPLQVTPPLRILGMIASPGDMDPLDVEREQGRMRAALKDLEAQGLVQLEWLPGQTWRHLQRAMRGGPWHIFHFIGHGGFHQGEGVLALADDEGKTSLLSATQLGYLLANHSALRLAVLNACEGARADKRDLFSSTAATLARRGLPAVLAMQYDITDRAAIEYTRAFYEALADQLPVDAALAEARAAIHLGVHNSLEWGTPVLYLRAPDGMLFDLQGQATPRPQATLSAAEATPAPSPAPTRSAQPAQKEPEQPKPPAKTKEDWLKEGEAHYTAQRYEEALAAFEQVFQLDPQNVQVHNSKGYALWSLKRYEEALAAFEQAILLNPQYARAYYNKGWALRGRMCYEEALIAFDRAIQLDPQLAPAYNDKGAALNALKRYEEALAAFDRAIQLDPQQIGAYIGKSFALFNLAHYEEALAAAERAIQLDPQQIGVYNNKGRALKALGRTAEAEQAFQKARELRSQ